MKAKFKVKRLGAQEYRSVNFDEILTEQIFCDIALRLVGITDFEIDWIEEKNIGRIVELEYNNHIYYLTISQTGTVTSRNNYFQSVSTAFAIYLSSRVNIEKKSFYFYFMPFEGNNKTQYMMFMYRILVSSGIKFVNLDFGIGKKSISPFSSVRNLILEREGTKARNSSNSSSYITDEGDEYHIYGKTFGANQKETALISLALVSLTDKPIKLFQILDNDSKSISKNDINLISDYLETNPFKQFEIINDDNNSIDSKNETNISSENLRSPKFIYNLLNKHHGIKQCALCNCKIESIIQAAHILPISMIKRIEFLSEEEKYNLATDVDNGIWLCQNHHKLFDSNLIWFDNGVARIDSSIDIENYNFINKITEYNRINPNYINDRMLSFFDMREGKVPRSDILSG
jgi:predicted restriction endonuclease